MSGFATCTVCSNEMVEGGACSATHVSLAENGPWVKRVTYGDEADDWGAAEGRPCHDCNVGPGQPHHDGCDVERCPTCGRQMLGCLDPGVDDAGHELAKQLAEMQGYPPCGWQYLASNVEADDDPIVKVLWKDEGDFGFISTVRRSEMRGLDPSTPWLEVIAAKRDAGEELGVPYDPNRQRPAGTRREAKALAREHDAVYEEV